MSLLSDSDLLPKFLAQPLNEFNSVRFKVSKYLGTDKNKYYGSKGAINKEDIDG